MPKYTHQVSVKEVNELADAICHNIFVKLGVKSHVAEASCLLAYMRVSETVRSFPDDTRDARSWLILKRASTVIPPIVDEVGALSETALATELAPKPAAH